jgi:hypothetical protein
VLATRMMRGFVAAVGLLAAVLAIGATALVRALHWRSAKRTGRLLTTELEETI